MVGGGAEAESRAELLLTVSMEIHLNLHDRHESLL